jgi:hypothetical protein
VALVGPVAATAWAESPGVVACPEGQVMRGLNFLTRKLICVSVAAPTSAAARVTRQTHQSIPSGGLTPLALETELLDTGDLHAAAAEGSQFTAPVAGLYLVHVGVVWGTGAYQGSTTPYVIALRKNGESYVAWDTKPLGPSDGGLNHQHLTTLVKLSAGDALEVLVGHGYGDGSYIVASPSLPFQDTPEVSMTWVASE